MRKSTIFQALCVFLLGTNLLTAQNSSFSFVYDGPTTIFVGEDCEAELDWGHPNTPIAISNIPGGEITSFEILSISGGYSIGDILPPGGVVMVLYEATDNFNNTAIFGFNVFIGDNIPPSFDIGTLPADMVVGCVGELPDPPEVTGFDNCMDPELLFSITLDEVVDVEDCMGGIVMRTWVVDDDLGNQTSYTQTITVRPDTSAPVFVVPPIDGLGACDDAMNLYTIWLNEQRTNQMADDGGCGNLNYSDNAPDAGVLVGFCGDVPVQFNAADDCGNMTTVTATFSIQNNIPPTIETQASDGMADCSSGNPESAFQAWINNQGGASAFDDCGSVSWTTNPPNPTLGDTCSNMIIVEFIADDGCGNLSSTTATFMAVDTTPPTIITQPQIKFLNCAIDDVDAELSAWLNSAGSATAQDLCTSNEDLSLSYQIGTTSLDTNGVFAALQDSFMTGCRDGIIINGILFNQVIALLDVDFVFIDACGNAAPVSSKFVVIDNSPPVIDSGAIDLVLSCDTMGDLVTSFTSWYESGGGAEASDGCAPVVWRGEPSMAEALEQLNMALDTSCGETALVEVSFIAMDFCGNESMPTSASFGLIDTIPPIINLAFDTLFLSCTQLDTIPNPEVIDDCSTGININFQDSVILGSDSLGCGQFQQTIIRIWVASDLCENSSSATQIIRIRDSVAPSFTVPEDTMVNCIPLDSIATFSFPTNILDDCDPDPQISFADVLNGSGCNFSVQRTWLVEDACGNSASGIQNILITDSIAPEVVSPPLDLLIACNDTTGAELLFNQWINDLAGAQIEDNCSTVNSFMAIPGSYILGDSSTYPGTAPVYSLNALCGQIGDTGTTIALVYYDECLNASETFTQFKISDTIAPELTNCLSTILASVDPDSCTASFLIFPPTIADNCSELIDISFNYQIDDLALTEISSEDSIRVSLSAGAHTITWFATDCSGNMSSCSTSLITTDAAEPEISCPTSFEVFVSDSSCVTTVDLPIPTVISSSCTSPVSGYIQVAGPIEVDSFPFNIDSTSVSFETTAGVSIITYFLSTGDGFRDTCMINLNVIDTIPPTAICKDTTLVYFPSPQVTNFIEFSDIDNGSFNTCGIDSISISPNSFNCTLGDTILNVALIITDLSGNSAQCMSIVTVESPKIEPSFTLDICMPDTLFLFSNIHFSDSLNITYTWSGPMDFSSNMRDPFLTGIDSSMAGIYELVIEGVGECAVTGMVGVTFSSFGQPQISISEPTICLADTIELATSSLMDSVIYQWTILGDDGMILLIDSTNNPGYQYMPLEVGIYSALVNIIGMDCQTDPSDIIRWEVLEIPVAMIQEVALNACFDDSIQLTAVEFDSILNYQWTGPNGFLSDMAAPPIIVVDSSTIGVYYLQVANGNCTSALDSITVVGQSRPSAPFISGDSKFCLGGTMILIAEDSNSFSFESYMWIGPSGQIVALDSNTLSIEGFGLMDTGEWKVIGMISGCVSDTSEGYSVFPDESNNLSASNDGPVCEGETLSLDVQPVFADATYVWSGPNSYMANIRNPMVENVASGFYYVTISTQNGCTVLDSTEVVVHPLPIIVDISNDFETCVAGDIIGQLIPSINSEDSTEFQWTLPNGEMFFDSVLIIDNVSSTNNGWYQLIVSANGCNSIPDSFFVDVIDQPTALTIQGPDMLCEGAAFNVSTNGPVADSIQYIWITPTGDTLIANSNSFSIPEVSPQNSGTYSVIVQFGECMSTVSNTIDLSVQAGISQPEIQTESRICEGDSLALELIGGPIDGATYMWTGPGGFASDEIRPVLYPATPLATGNYFVTIQIGDCTSPISNSFFVEVTSRPASPRIEMFESGICLSDPEPFMLCLEQSSTIEGAIYHWENGDNGTSLGSTTGRCIDINDFSSFAAGENSFLVSAEVNGCRSFTSPVISIPMFEFPNETAETDDQLFICVGDEPIISATMPIFSIGQWTALDNLVVFENPMNSTTLVQGLQEGTNQLIWSLSFGACINFSTDTAIVVVEPLPQLTNDTIFVDFGNSRNFNVLPNDIVAGDYTLTIAQTPNKGNTLHQGSGDFVYTSNIGYVGDDSFVYRICSDNCPDQCDEATVFLKVGDESDCFVPTLFTPNNDGVNDEWIIPCLEADRFPNNRVVVFNEWGDAVFEADTYLNDWRGMRNDKELPVGTYYYVVDFGDGSAVRKGFLILER